MSKNDVHIVPDNKQWAVKLEKEKQAQKVVSTQREAIKIGREIAKSNKSELIVHGRDGAIREKNTYGKDPRSIKG
jgi:uncharacterized protein YdaT